MNRKKNDVIKNIDEISDIWETLTIDQKIYLRENCQIQNYRKNEIVYSEGEIPKHMICLVKGKVKIFKTGVGNRSQIVRMIKPFEYFAYRAMFANEPYVTSAMAFEASTAYLIPEKVILTLIKQNSDLAFYFIRALSIDLGISDARTVTLTQKHVRGRLAETLLFMRDTYGLEEDGATISIYLSREDIANLSNMTTSNAIRTLSLFVDEKIISVDGRKIKIIDFDKLQKISKNG